MPWLPILLLFWCLAVRGEHAEPIPSGRREAHADTGKSVSGGTKLVGKCVACHSKIEALAPHLKTVEGLERHLPFANDKLLKSMVEKTRKMGGFSAEEENALFAAVKRGRDAVAAGVPAKVDPCYTTAAENQRKIDLLPQIDGKASALAGRLAKAIQNGALIYYDRSHVPFAYQSERVGISKIPSVVLGEKVIVNETGKRKYDYPQAGGSHEFPWKSPAATDMAPQVKSLHFVIPPDRGPVASMFEVSKTSHPDHYGGTQNVVGPNLGWEYKPGTQFVEALAVPDPDSGELVVFEVRTRMKLGTGEWVSDVLRPFSDPGAFQSAVRSACGKSPAQNPGATPRR